MTTLTIDTSTNILGVGLLQDGHVIGEVVTNINKDHSTRLMPAIVSLMEELQIKQEQLTNIIVAEGPGSYTGVRIGVTTAKSLAWALNIPVTGVSSLQVLTYNSQFFNGLISPFFDARRSNVYTGLYESNNKMHQVEADTHVSMEDWLEKLSQLNKQILFLSPQIAMYQDMIIEIMGDNAIIPEGPFHYPKPAYLYYASLGEEADHSHSLTPNYIRLAEAELNWLRRQEGE